MRIDRRNRWLAAALLALVAAHLALRPSLPSAAEAGPLFPGFEAEAVTRLLLERGAEPDVERVELFRVPADDGAGGGAGGRWVVRQAFGHPAQGWAVEQLLGRVAALRRSDRVAREASSRALYGVDESGVRVLLGGAEGAVLAAFVQGEAARPGAGDVRGSYVRPVSAEVEGDAVYRAPLLAPLEPRVARWLDTRLLPVVAEDVVWLRLRLGEGGPELALARGADGAWRTVPVTAEPGAAADEAGPEVPAVRVERALELAAGAYFEEVLGTGRAGEADGLERPGLVLELVSASGADAPPVAVVLGAEGGAEGAAGPRRALRGAGPSAGGAAATGLLGGESGWLVAVPGATVARLEDALRSLAEAARRAGGR